VKPGTRLKSATCDTEVMVIRAGDGRIECGGAPMAETKPAEAEALSPDFSGGTLMGKRYVDAEGQYELLCVKPGKGSLAVDGVALTTKDAKPLPASD
jgi:hypothetical protein